MNILVALKPVRDPAQPFALCATAAPEWPEPTQLNPLDTLALEAALRLREAGQAQRVMVITVGPVRWENHLRTALAMGADEAIVLQSDGEWSPLLVAKGLAAAAQRFAVDLLLCGRQTVDRNHNQTGVMAAALLAWGQMTQATALQVRGDALHVEREVEGAREGWLLPLPAVVTVDWGLNGIEQSGGVRYASLPNLVKARRKPLLRVVPSEWQLCEKSQVHLRAWQLPEARAGGRRVASLAELLAGLRQQGVLAERGSGGVG
ncbi:MAG: electron transfer flavoprotein subunit beta/FixA family protein [Magnetococcales bacterium]|nr:electron transfer flavoprotein subunit beta/FixA family protein [Magnetococcales bacterium]MBF0116080.1 electron transfer flavoprotein subunit beta/FixA family protein [Magnetococcales bacterium]